MNESGNINFLHAVKLVLRIVFAKNDEDLLNEIEESENKLGASDPKAMEKILKSQEKHMEKSGLCEGCNMQTQIAAMKIQQLFKARQARKEATKACNEKRQMKMTWSSEGSLMREE